MGNWRNLDPNRIAGFLACPKPLRQLPIFALEQEAEKAKSEKIYEFSLLLSSLVH
jgi:hypothetical protein